MSSWQSTIIVNTTETHMKLRKLQIKDAPLMFEWMQDDSVVHYFRKDFKKLTIDDCMDFINRVQKEANDIHLAIADDRDEYMGTVSLKQIRRSAAELGIVLRGTAMGRGYALFGMNEISEYGYRKHGIREIYWCVDPENQRAVQFYDRNGYRRCEIPKQVVGYTEEEKRKYLWYHVQHR